jgi:hypothetical protein
VTTYLIEAYVAIGDMTDLQERARAAAEAMKNEGYVIRYLRSVLIRADETCFYLFDAVSEDAVVELARRARLDYERIVEAEEYRLSPARRSTAPTRSGHGIEERGIR